MYPVLEDANYDAHVERIEQGKALRPSKGSGLDPNGPDVLNLQPLREFFVTKDYHFLMAHFNEMEDEKTELDVYEKAASFYCQAYHRAGEDCQPEELFKEEPVLPTAYAALSLIAGHKMQYYEALRYMQLAKLCGGDIDEPWYKDAYAGAEYAMGRLTPVLMKILPYIVEDDKRALLIEVYPEMASNAEFDEAVAAVKADPSKIVYCFYKYPALKMLMDAISRDYSPEILIERMSDEKLTELASSAESPIARLSPQILSRIASHMELSDISALRNTNVLMNGLLGHWSIWRSLYLKMIGHSQDALDSDIFYAPLSHYDWESMTRLYRFVRVALAAIGPPSDQSPIVALPASTRYPSPSQRVEIRRLLQKFRIPLASEHWEYTTPELHVFLAIELLSVSDKTAITLHSLAQGGEMIFVFISALASLHSPDQFASSWISAKIAAIVAWRREHEAHFLNQVSFDHAMRYSFFSSDGAFSDAVKSALYWHKDIPEDLDIRPIAHSSGMALHRRRPSTSSSSTPSTSPAPFHESFAGLSNVKSISGVYRLFIHYNHVELEDELDSGIVELIQDPETWRFSGRGIDTMRGPFKIVDNREEAEIEGIRQAFSDMTLSAAHPAATPNPSSLDFEYEDGTCIVMRGLSICYGLSGSLTHNSEHDIEPATPFGGFTLLFDHRITYLSPEEREARFQEKWAATASSEGKTRPHTTFLPYPFVRPQGTYWAPWDHAVINQGQCELEAYLVALVMGMSVLREDPGVLTVFYSAQIVNHENAGGDVNPDFMQSLPVLGRLPTETQKIYEIRQLIWQKICVEYLKVLSSLAAMVDTTTVETSIRDLQPLSTFEALGTPLYVKWCRTLRGHPNQVFLTPPFLEYILRLAQFIYSDMNPQQDDVSPNFLGALGSAPRNNKRSLGKRLLSWIKSPIGMISSLVALGAITATGAFALGSYMSRKPSAVNAAKK